MKVTAPIYLLKSRAPCWKCGAEQPVVALACAEWEDDEGVTSEQYGNEPALLANIENMPLELLSLVRASRAGYELRHSHTADCTYYVNTCGCGAFFGDFFLSEPGGPFDAWSEAAVLSIKVAALPLSGTFEVICGYSAGMVGLILRGGDRCN